MTPIKYELLPDMFRIDELAMYMGRDLTIGDKLRIHQPTIGEIVDYGEREYFNMVQMICAIPSDMKSTLFDMGIDYEQLPDFELFIMLTRKLPAEKTDILFGDLDLTKMELKADPETKALRMVCPSTGIVIDEMVYLQIATYVRTLHSLKPKEEKAATKWVKNFLIEEDRKKLAKQSEKPYHSQFKDLISAMMRYPGFKYNSRQLNECGLCEFMDTVKGASIYVSSTALLKGMYSGMIDVKKIDKKELDWMRSAR